MDLRSLIMNPGEGQYPALLRPYLAPLTRSIAPAQSKMVPSRSAGALNEEAIFGGTGLTFTTAYAVAGDATAYPWGNHRVLAAADSGYLLTSSPLGVPTGPRPALGVGYCQSSRLWKLSGVADGWSRPYGANPGRKPTTAFALGNWTPFPGGTRPLPSNPAPAAMLTPGF